MRPGEYRPDPRLMTYYAIRSLVIGPLFPFLLVPSFFKYRTLRYRLDDEGISMRWGILFRREVSLTYARIQDIHLTSNAIERWLGLGRIHVQTASASSGAEMTLEGLRQYEQLRDFLYVRMRGTRAGRSVAGSDPSRPAGPLVEGGADDALTTTLREVAREVRLLREQLAEGRARGDG
mgnify:CR=1 FL=1